MHMPVLPRSFCRLVVAGLTASISAGTAIAETTWIMASGYPETSFFTQNIQQFADEVEERSGGELKIDLRSNDSLIKLDAIKRAVQSGQVQAGEIRLSVYGNEDPIYNLDNTPGVAVDYDQAWTLMEASKPYLDELFGKDGMRVVAYAPWPGQGFYTKEPIKSLDDLSGLKLRIYSQQTQKLGSDLGAEAIILPFAEVPQAFATNMIDSLWTSAQTGVDIQAWDYLKAFSYTGTMFQKNAVIVNERAFRALPEEIQQIVLDEGAKATERGWKLSQEASDATMKTLEEHGMALAEPPADLVAKMDQIGTAMADDWRSTASAEEIAVLDAYLAARR
ncbi:TRAP transporter substrate-binding protein [Paracoccus sp. R12_1]|uniref:TRAP transporter substrate-binding protein n=1 Tax=unclassified Paracoccus (in: a-proteobacteria) TaxID=2688777 RepID=UPI001ADCF9CA|nr:MULTISPECIES: TRAP transporter substrate-binding protein [unclassified Paracoccus (in: a-proteobacteria)]MBO9457002.1 TRAP transporter substrate-binding protein [Paracoccus sp. R12_2]MBO9488113.1 TRAP transporter substrate-binding protein [Paracoccus sp. R12_1]